MVLTSGWRVCSPALNNQTMDFRSAIQSLGLATTTVQSSDGKGAAKEKTEVQFCSYVNPTLQ
jgi:hypothetical protein